jgi:hypothetical protein
VNQGVEPFTFFDGLLCHEKKIDETVSLRRGEFFVCPSGGYLRCRGSCNETPLAAVGHGRAARSSASSQMSARIR